MNSFPMNSRRCSLVLASSCSLLLVLQLRADEPRNAREALLSHTWTWSQGSEEFNKRTFLANGEVDRGEPNKKNPRWEATSDPFVFKVIGSSEGNPAVTLKFNKDFTVFSGPAWNPKNVIVGRRIEKPATTLAKLEVLTLDPNQPLLDTFSQLAPNASAWVLAGLDEGVPPNVRQNLTYIREDLLDEYKQKPKASQDAYKLAHQLCSSMITALDERDQTLVRAGFRAVQADAGISGTNQALQARRNYMMSWPQYAREQAQRAELIRQGTAGAQVGKALPKVEWSTRTANLRKTLDGLYAQFREALRQSPPVK
jgi:hypothetical protein